MLVLYQTHDLSVECCEVVKMPMALQNWLDHTQTPQEVQMDILRQMEREITGGEKTDFAPYYRDATTDGPSASVQKAQSSKRSISAANALHLFKKVVDKRREIW